MLLTPVVAGSVVPLRDEDALPPKRAPRGGALDREQEKLLSNLQELGAALYAESRRALLVVLQARDAGGKDGTIRKVFGALNPQNLRLTDFGAPSREELAHDFLWRVHRAVPPFGRVGVFNRSHYEDVLVARVRGLVPEQVWSRRYAQINAFERILVENGVTILKFFLHISRDEQKERLRKRLHDPAKNWKFQQGDLEDRRLWDDYTAAYQDVLRRCSTPHGPWYVVPADKKPVRNLLVAQVVVDTLRRMSPAHPPAEPEVLRLLEEIV
jgi:PPK2 family polyphosphate:nucleotide phosphotransferase